MSDEFIVPAETAKAPKGSAARLIQVAKSQVGYIRGTKRQRDKIWSIHQGKFSTLVW
jgi:hypothetical protein